MRTYVRAYVCACWLPLNLFPSQTALFFLLSIRIDKIHRQCFLFCLCELVHSLASAHHITLNKRYGHLIHSHRVFELTSIIFCICEFSHTNVFFVHCQCTLFVFGVCLRTCVSVTHVRVYLRTTHA